ncbi:recombinase family protein [Ruania zhangjianzhongii]|uniref:recombinase family protein n=1 Tax=Ruania zhangjianzhongii TaxID=2603206 RepID=UPI001F1D3082|nr:recombinase family protein [Ruania zhangjianzhongii]
MRVSTVDQNEARQIAALGEVDRIISEKVSGSSADRPQLQEMIKYAREGDVIRAKSPDRLSRSTRDLLGLIEELRSKGVQAEFVDNPAMNTNTSQGEFTLTILAAVAQLERATIRERQAEGIAIAKAQGVYERAPKLTGEQVEQARQRIESGVPKATVARDLGVSRQTLYTALAGEGRYAATGGRVSDRHFRAFHEAGNSWGLWRVRRHSGADPVEHRQVAP